MDPRMLPCSPPLKELHDRNEDITDIKFAPMGSILAVASAERTIDLYGKWHVPNDPHSPHYDPTATNMVIQRIAVCRGHSSAVTHMDFSDDAFYLRCVCVCTCVYVTSPENENYFFLFMM